MSAAANCSVTCRRFINRLWISSSRKPLSPLFSSLATRAADIKAQKRVYATTWEQSVAFVVRGLLILTIQ